MEKNGKKKNGIVILTTLLAVVIALSGLFCVIADGALIKDSLGQLEQGGQITTPLARPIESTPGQLSKFGNGTKYLFTDKTKIDAFRAGSEEFDTTTVVVDSSQPHGTKENPYVIASIDDWETFTKQMETDSTRGSGLFFVLGKDLDFDGIDFHPVRFFNGTFYGLGYSLKNINCDNWQYWNGSSYVDIGTTTVGFGVFCRTDNAVIADLIVENYVYSNMPFVSYDASRSTCIGAIVGLSYANDTLLNCHTVGRIEIGTQIGAKCAAASGLVGFRHSGGVSTTVLIYRCSASLEAVSKSLATVMFGGLIGEQYRSTVAYIYDSVASVNVSIEANTSYLHSSSAIGWQEGTTSTVMENFVGTVDVTSDKVNYSGALMGIMTAPTVKNVYVDGQIGTVDNKKPYAVLAGMIKLSSGVSNANIVKPVDKEYAKLYGNDSLASYPGKAEPHEHQTSEYLYYAAKNNVGTGLLSQIWDAEKIGKGYDPDNSPVRNYLVATVTFKNLLSGDLEEDLGIATNDYMKDDALPQPEEVKDNHVFLGWTADKSGESEPYKKLPSGLYGDVTLYAVWGLPDSYVDAYIQTSIGVKDNISTIEYDSVSDITLVGEVNHNGPTIGGLSNPSIVYQWQKGAESKGKNTTGRLSVKTVKDSGIYTYKYRITDANEPLWRYDGESADAQEIEIEKAHTVTLEGFKISEETVPYYGKNLGEVEFSAVLKNKAGKEIVQESHRWEITVGEVEKGENSLNVYIVPSDKENYEEAYIKPVTFNSEALKLKFNLGEISRKLECEMEYGQPYGTAEVIYEFNKVYMAALESGDSAYNYVKDKAPYFEGKPIVSEGSATDLYEVDSRFDRLKEEITIEVTFETASYNVTFNFNDGGKTPNKIETYKYGDALKQPTPDPVNGNQLFVGWYFTDAQGEERAWRFNSEEDAPRDRVTGNLELKAEWLTPTNLESLTVNVAPGREFMAQTKIVEGDLIVKAIYIGTKGSDVVRQEVTLKWTDYNKNIEYVSSPNDSILHVKEGGAEIKVSYTFGNTVSKTVKINVLPIDISDSLSGLDFGADSDGTIYRVYEEGVVQNVRDIPVSEYPTDVQGILTGIRYSYTKSNGTPLNAEDVKEMGTYNVKVEYLTESDYYAEPTNLKLVISLVTDVKIEWSENNLMYNGEQQHPEAKVYYLDGSEVKGVTVTYDGDYDAKEVKNGYKIKAKLNSNFKITEGEECEFNIIKAELSVPTFTGGIVYDGTDKNVEEKLDGFNALLMEIVTGGTGKSAGKYFATIKLKDTANCSWSDGSTQNKRIEWTVEKATLIPDWGKWEFVSDGESTYAPRIESIADGLAESDKIDLGKDFVYKLYDEEGNELSVSEVSEVGSYRIVASLNAELAGNYALDEIGREWTFVVVPKSGMTVLTIEWGEKEFLYDGSVKYPTYTVKDSNGTDVTESVKDILKFSEGYRKEKELGTYTVKVTLKDSENYFIRTGGVCKYKIVDENGYAPDEDETEGNKPKPEPGSDGGALEELLEKIKGWPLWQLIAGSISILLTLLFLAKTASYESRRKKAVKKTEKYTTGVYAATGLFGLTMTSWTVIASCLMVAAAASFVIMLIAKSRCIKAEETLEESKEEYNNNLLEKKKEEDALRRDEEDRRREQDNMRREDEMRRRDEEMKMMFMHMMGGAGANMGSGGAQGAAYTVQSGIGAEEIRGIISETVTALLPGVQQLLPQPK